MAENLEHSEEESGAQSDEAIVAEAHTRFALAEESESENRRLGLEDLRFRAGEQWPIEIKADRDRKKRPCLTINRIPQFVQQVTNDQRQNRPSIKIHPVDDLGDPETAKVIQGLIRHIENNSNADVAYDTAFESSVTSGLGYLRLVTRYADPMSFNQELLIERIRNPNSVYFDPFSQKPDGSDANWAQIVEDLSRDEYKGKYGESKLAGMTDWESLGNQAPDWVTKDGCRVAEYFRKRFVSKEIVQLEDGRVVSSEELPEGLTPEILKTLPRRIAAVPIVEWFKINGVEILEKTVWPGQYIPIVPVYGTELYIDGKRILEGIIRNAKDSQRMYNYWASAETEAIALAPRAPFIAADGQTEQYPEWKTANTENHAVLRYKPIALQGQVLGQPQRNTVEPAVQAITQARMIAGDDLKATTGIYDAAMGAKSNETSGIAIQRRNVQAQTSNFHFMDNLARSIKHVGRICVDVIPHVYDTAQTARIIGEEGDERIVKLNQATGEVGKDGQPLIYDLSVGKYDVTVDVGPSFASKRQEAVASMIEFTRSMPQAAAGIADLLAKNMDWPGAAEISERLKKMLPPGLAEDPKQKGQPVPPQVQAQLQQMTQMVEGLTAELNKAKDPLELKRMELESRERIENKKLEVEVEIELAKIDAKDSIAILTSEIRQIEQRMSLLKVSQPIETEEQEQQPAEPMGQPMPGAPNQDPNAPQPDGGISADVGEGALPPTGGASPGQPMEGNP